MQLDRPIFIVGIGRCGSTIFHRILCEHPQISWLTGFADCNPSRPSMSRIIMKMADWPFAGSLVRRIYPSECYRFWEYHCPGFRRPFRDLLAEDVSDRSKNRVRNALNVVTTDRRPRLSMKITGWPSFYKTYDAYNITTYAFHHKEQDVIDSIQKHGYEYKESKMDQVNFNFLLRKII